MKVFQVLRYVFLATAGIATGALFATSAHAASEEMDIFGSSAEQAAPENIFDCDSIRSRNAFGMQLLPGDSCREELQEELAPAALEVSEEEFYPEKYKRFAKLKTPEDIEKAFGAPEKDDPILPVKDAPPAFQAFYAAMMIGDEGLAKQYAKRAARVMKDYRHTNQRFSKLVSTEAKKPQIHSIESSLEGMMEEQGIELPDEVKSKFLELMEEEEESGATIDFDELRARYREQFVAAGIKPSTDGRVDVALFLDIEQPESVQLAFRFKMSKMDQDRLAERTTKVPVNIQAYYVGSPTQKQLVDFANNKVPGLSLSDGNEIVREELAPFGMSGAPIALYISPDDQRVMHIEKGDKSQIYVDELINYLGSKEDS